MARARARAWAWARVKARGRGRGRGRVRVISPEQLDELALLELAALVGVVLVKDLIEPSLLLDVRL